MKHGATWPQSGVTWPTRCGTGRGAVGPQMARVVREAFLGRGRGGEGKLSGRLVLSLPPFPGRSRADGQQAVTAITRRMFWHGLVGL